MSETPPTISIDQLISLVEKGGIVKTGIDVYDKRGRLLLQKDVLIKQSGILLIVKNAGITKIPIVAGADGGLWDSKGRKIPLPKPEGDPGPVKKTPNQISPKSPVLQRVLEIQKLKKVANEKYNNAKQTLVKSIDDIKKNDGLFDVDEVRATVEDLFDFLKVNDTAFSFLTKEIITYDDYLYNHSINVCTIATTILNKFIETVKTEPLESLIQKGLSEESIAFIHQDVRDISLGFFLHDVGKTLIPEKILNKNGPLTDEEFENIKNHSFTHGSALMDKNNIHNPFTRNTALYHHCSLYQGENRTYPADKDPEEIPLYVKMCKFADIYDAMTSKRAYKDAMNPTGVVTSIFRHYADKNKKLQLVLHAFVKAVGIYPPGSIVTLGNGQLAYIIDSNGPIALPFTDRQGQTITKYPEPIDLGKAAKEKEEMAIDHTKPLIDPIKVYNLLPDFLKKPT